MNGGILSQFGSGRGYVDALRAVCPIDRAARALRCAHTCISNIYSAPNHLRALVGSSGPRYPCLIMLAQGRSYQNSDIALCRLLLCRQVLLHVSLRSTPMPWKVMHRLSSMLGTPRLMRAVMRSSFSQTPRADPPRHRMRGLRRLQRRRRRLPEVAAGAVVRVLPRAAGRQAEAAVEAAVRAARQQLQSRLNIRGSTLALIHSRRAESMPARRCPS